nr:NADH dehydrogenase subunit 6 [Proceratium itoi]
MTKLIQILNIYIWLFLMLMLIFMLISIYHPISLILMMIIYSMLIFLNISLWKENYIYSIMLFLIIISGLLIIFLYFSSLISNEKMTINWQIFYLYPMLIIPISFMCYNNFKSFMYYQSKSYEMNPIYKINMKNFYNISNIYEHPYNNFTILCMMFLLLCLILIIKLSNPKSMPMRKLN